MTLGQLLLLGLIFTTAIISLALVVTVVVTVSKFGKQNKRISKLEEQVGK